MEHNIIVKMIHCDGSYKDKHIKAVAAKRARMRWPWHCPLPIQGGLLGKNECCPSSKCPFLVSSSIKPSQWPVVGSAGGTGSSVH